MSLIEIETQWSFDDVVMANKVLNAISDAEASANAKAGATDGTS